MEGSFATVLGTMAAACTTLAYAPQVRKAWPRRSTHDLSLGMLIVLMCGLSLWIIYGFVQSDRVIIGANMLSVALVGTVLACKIRDLREERREGKSRKPRGRFMRGE